MARIERLDIIKIGPFGAKVFMFAGRKFNSVTQLVEFYGESRNSVQRAIAADRLPSFLIASLMRQYDLRKNPSKLAEAKRIIESLEK